MFSPRITCFVFHVEHSADRNSIYPLERLALINRVLFQLLMLVHRVESGVLVSSLRNVVVWSSGRNDCRHSTTVLGFPFMSALYSRMCEFTRLTALLTL